MMMMRTQNFCRLIISILLFLTTITKPTKMALHPSTFVTGNAPTTVPAEYSISFHGMNIPNDVMSLKRQPQVFISHGEDYQLWSEENVVTHAMEKFVMVRKINVYSLLYIINNFGIKDLAIFHLI